MRGSLLLVCLLAGCATERVVEVKIPVPVRADPPAELVNCTAALPVPTFQACQPAGWSCLNPTEEAKLRSLVHVLLACDRGWRAWSAGPTE